MKTYNKTIIFLLTLVILFLKTTAIKGIESKDSLYVIGNDYFEIICYEKNDYASDIEKSILKKYHRLLEDYEIQKMDKVTIRIYPSLAQFHEAVNMQGASNWVVATAWGNKEIRMTAPTAQGIPITYKDMTEKLPVHEFTHCLVMNFTDPSQIPIWLWEGVSLYEAEQKYDLTKTQYIKEKKLPAFEELNSYQKAFEFGYSLVEYIISKWGKNRLKDLITANGNIENALGISQEEFYNGWNEFLKKNY